MQVDCQARTDEALEGVTFADLHAVVDRALTYSRVRISTALRHVANEMADNEGPFPELCRSIRDSADDISPSWKIDLDYIATDSDEFDFEKVISRDFSTAYKMRTSGSPKLIRFKLKSARFGPLRGRVLDDEVRERIASEMLLLRAFYGELESKIATLDGWASADLDMRVWCPSCWNDAIITNHKLRTYAISHSDLDKFSKKLTCQRCGKREARRSPSAGVP